MLLLFTMLVATACVSSAGDTTKFPTGTFVTDSGRYQIILTDNDSFTFLESGWGGANFSVAARGTYSIHTNEFTFETDSYCDGIGAGKATYTWTYKNDTLSFTIKGEDKCSARLDSMVNDPFHKEQ
jgi:hypothetical protein